MVKEYTLITRTPLWTGDILGRSERARETSIIGSLRWWYEAIVRGLGGYACDPSQGNKCEWDPKLEKKSVCPACYLFGATGWARLFSLRIGELGTVPVFFRHLSYANNSWMNLIFKKQLGSQRALWGRTILTLIDRGVETAYALRQAEMVLMFTTLFGGIGARTQHGFGQILLDPMVEYDAPIFSDTIRELKAHIGKGVFKHGRNPPNAPDLKRFVFLLEIVNTSNRIVRQYLNTEPFPQEVQNSKVNLLEYLPCAFELRYDAKTDHTLPIIGFRRWIKERAQARWSQFELVNLLGRTGKRIPDDERQGSHLSFAMPFKVAPDQYAFKVFGFSPKNKTGQLKVDLKAYMDSLLGVSSNCWSGDAWLNKHLGGNP